MLTVKKNVSIFVCFRKCNENTTWKSSNLFFYKGCKHI